MKINPFSPSHISPAQSISSPSSPKKERQPDNLTELFHNSVFDKLQAKPKIVRQITVLNSKIYKIEKAIEGSKEKIEQLEGGKAARLPLIGILIKYLFKWYNKSLIIKEESQNQQLLSQEDQYKKDVADLRRLLPTEEEEKPSNIFALEYEMRLALEKDFPGKAKYLAIFQNKIRPLIEQTKHSLRQTSYHFVAHAAAAKGKAAQAGFKALKDLAENQPVIKDSNVSSQQVFLLPKEGAVFKLSSERAKEEEEIVNALLDLMSQEATVGTFSIHEASVDKFGIKISPEEHSRGFTLEDLSPALRDGIIKKLSKEDLLILKKIEKNPSKDPDLMNYEKMEKLQWHVKLPEKSWEIKSFKELQMLNLSAQLDSASLIGTSQQTAVPFKDHLLSDSGKGSSFAQALHYFPTLQGTPQTLLLSPDLSDKEAKASYVQCEACKWSYIDSSQILREVDFKTLHSLYLQNEVMHNISPVPIGERSSLPTSLNLYQALNVEWKAVSSELMQMEYGSISELSDIEAKPFMKEMILMKDLDEDTRQVLLDRLTPDAEFNAILTGEVQLLDMYGSNLGVAPESTPEYERFKNIRFEFPSGPKNFKELVIDYLSGKISLNTPIQFEEQGTIYHQTLKDLPELQKALDVRWEFVIFDTDLSLTEDNRLQMQTYNNVEQHLIPLRSVLLETAWKDKLLSEETIERLMDSDERDYRVKQWIKKKDAPIYKQLSPSLRKEIEAYVAPLIQKYSLSEARKNGEDITIKGLTIQFSKELIDPIDHFELWQKLEDTLSSVPVRADDTWETLAKRHDQNVEELKKLNPGVQLVPGKKIKINYDLTSSFPTAVKKRKRIANQLFPRITHRQQEALLERQRNRKEYLHNYQELAESRLEGKELLEQLADFIKEPTAPLSSLRKDELLFEISKQKSSLLKSPKKLAALKQKICQECQPTYFNLIKAMYPLIADAYELNLAIYKNSVTAGKNIGLFTQSLEGSIAYALENFPQDSHSYHLAQLLQVKIDSVPDPAFFGHWG